MKNQLSKLFLLAFAATAITSCTSVNHSMREPNTRLELVKSDFNLSDQVSATATTTKILCIDFARLFYGSTGSVDHDGSTSLSDVSIPVIGGLVEDKTANYSLYELMQKNPNYDVVLYPQFETKVIKPFLGFGFIFKITTVKATSRY